MTLAAVANRRNPAGVMLAIAALLFVALAISLPGSGSLFQSAPLSGAVSSYLTQHSGPVPVIVETKGDAGPVRAMVEEEGGQVQQSFKVLSGFTATVSSAIARQLNHDSRIRRLSINAPVRLLGSAVHRAALLNRYDAIHHTPIPW